MQGLHYPRTNSFGPPNDNQCMQWAKLCNGMAHSTETITVPWTCLHGWQLTLPRKNTERLPECASVPCNQFAAIYQLPRKTIVHAHECSKSLHMHTTTANLLHWCEAPLQLHHSACQLHTSQLCLWKCVIVHAFNQKNLLGSSHPHLKCATLCT